MYISSAMETQRGAMQMMSDFIKRMDTIFYQQSFDAVNEFFSSFDSDAGIIEWLRKRKRSNMIISETAGENDVIAVIPGNDSGRTSDYSLNGDLFDGFRKIYSRTADGKPDFSRCINQGIKTALKYDPGWIVVSNPNTHILGDNNELRSALKTVDSGNNRILIPTSSRIGSRYIRIGKRNAISGKLNINRLERWAMEIEQNLSSRYGDIYIAEPMDLFHRVMYRWTFNVANASSFIVLSGKWLKSLNGRVMDETFTSTYYGVDFSIRHARKPRNVNFIDLQYKVKKGKVSRLSLPFDHVWDLCNRIYLTHKINNSYYSDHS
jgi:hypothetical protein